jgi:hypothetical protein
MKIFTVLRTLLAGFAVAAAAVPGAAHSTVTANFGSLLSGSFTPSGTFASLSVSQAGTNVFNFALSSNNLNSLFTNGAFIGAIAVNTTPNVSARNVTISNFSGAGVDGVYVRNGSGPGGGFDFRFDLGTGGGGQNGAHRLGANESASWTTTFNVSSPVQLTHSSFALHVQGLTSAQGGSAWYSAASAAPEPEIYAMMIAGLLLVGAAARRRQPGLAAVST